jgi:hypothetical protein
MKSSKFVALVALAVLVAFTGFAMADRLPNQTPENQVFSVTSVVEAIGSYNGAQSMQWTINGPMYAGLHTGILSANEVRSTTAYSESTQTNGGYSSETKSFAFDSRDKALDLFNLEATKTFTYATDANTGSVAQTAESITIDNMANYTTTADVIACPFGPSTSLWFPAFCNVVYAKSMSAGVTSAAMSSSAQTRTVAMTADVPTALNYNFDVKPDASSDIGYAMGTFGTEFGVSIKEARGDSMTPSVLNVYTDKATVAGMVAKFTKQYAYKSGFKL